MENQQARGGIVVVGAGIAGLWTALGLAPRPVTVVTAGRLGDGSSSWAQGGLAAAMGPDDNPGLHFTDTLLAGAGLVQPEAAKTLCQSGPEAVEKLASYGVPFDRNPDGSYRLGREAAHGRDRIVHVGGDEAGAAIMRTLTDAARRARHIEIRERTVAERILTDRNGTTGVVLWDVGRQRSVALAAGAVVLATGGLGGLYAVTTNPLHGQGHALAMAAEAGATLRDLEFVQFHPTGLDVGRDPAPLATEAIRGDGGQLKDALGHRFMTDLDPNAELAPRDVVARGVAKAIAETGKAFLDVRGALGASFRERYQTVYEACREAGLDPEHDLLPVAPAAHYHMGGIRTDTDGRSDIDGLYAVGECASTGVHGANRLASNSLLEAIVFGERVAEDLKGRTIDARPSRAGDTALSHRPATDLDVLRRGMAQHAGLLRSAAGLSTLEKDLRSLTPRSTGEAMAVTAALGVTASALAREESRGAHQRLDFPETGEPRHSLARLSDGGWTISFERLAS